MSFVIRIDALIAAKNVLLCLPSGRQISCLEHKEVNVIKIHALLPRQKKARAITEASAFEPLVLESCESVKNTVLKIIILLQLNECTREKATDALCVCLFVSRRLHFQFKF